MSPFFKKITKMEGEVTASVAVVIGTTKVLEIIALITISRHLLIGLFPSLFNTRIFIFINFKFFIINEKMRSLMKIIKDEKELSKDEKELSF